MVSLGLLGEWLKGGVVSMPRRTAVLSAWLLAVLVLAGCAGSAQRSGGQIAADSGGPQVTGSGRLVSKDISLGEFSEVEIGSAFKVDITRAESSFVSVTADDNLIGMVEVYRQGETLRVGLKSGSYRDATYRAKIGMPDVRRLRLSGASTGTLSGLKPESLELGLSGASHLTGRLEGGRLAVVVGEASSATLGGSADDLTLNVSGASQANLGDLYLRLARVNLAGASNATLNIKEKLDAEVRGASSLYYVGNPSLGSVAAVEGSSLRRR
jgi:hypothetical protein